MACYKSSGNFGDISDFRALSLPETRIDAYRHEIHKHIQTFSKTNLSKLLLFLSYQHYLDANQSVYEGVCTKKHPTRP